ncbi:MAG: transporter [Devosia sp.]|uniref:transporter n=1 Tax=Devosia sp. TaxID=1871048 RepID=UPI002615A36F|nr:transporter [Devosia sp.]MDB5542633.1 transporter [Devosia sp.]
MLARIAMSAVASVSMVTDALSWDGARAYHLRPEGASDISLTVTLLHADGTIDLGGNVEEGTELDVSVLTPTYHRSFDILGNVGTVLIGLPVGNVSFESLSGIIDVDTGFAQGDLLVGGTLGLVGTPSLSLMEYAQHKPGFQAAVAAKLFLPTGDYDPDRMLSLGQNRWSLQASLPISYVLGDTMIDPELTTLEVMPVVQIFGDNDDPFGAAVTSQDPIFGIEGHITRNFGNSVWAALDGYYEIGGETSRDGVAQGDGLETLALGATLGLVLSPSLAMRISYRELVYSNVPDGSARSLEVTSAFLF